MSFKEKYSSTTGKPITEEGFLQEPLGREFFDYAKNVIRSFINHVELKWYPGRTGMSLDDFVLDTASYAIEITREDYQKGKLRQENENSFKNFYWFRIKKAFFAKLDELGRDSKIAVFDERLGKYYEGTAVDFGLADEYDDFSLAEIVAENCEQDADDTSINESNKSDANIEAAAADKNIIQKNYYLPPIMSLSDFIPYFSITLGKSSMISFLDLRFFFSKLR